MRMRNYVIGQGRGFRDIIRAAFGSIDPDTGRRRVGFMANAESLLIMISSQSDKPPAGL